MMAKFKSDISMIYPKQQGAALLLILTFLVMIFSLTLIKTLSINQQTSERQQSSQSALVQAKDALMGYALLQNPPGRLPCPDTNNDGLANPLGNTCQSAIGQLPYKTLGIGEIKDGQGNLLWYAVDASAVNTSGLNFNSSSTTNLTVNQQAAIAVIIAPGIAINNQQRNTLARSEYLEGSNATSITTFETTGNDTLLPLETNSFWALMEKKVVSEAKKILDAYFSACGSYPFAASFGQSPTDSVANLHSGNFPMNQALPEDWNSGCASGISPTSWLVSHWDQQLLIEFCVSGNSCLLINGDDNTTVPLLILAPGVPLAGQSRPSTQLSNYFEQENSDQDGIYWFSKIGSINEVLNDTLHY